LHRIARESLANVARHAPSNRVELSVETIGAAGGCLPNVRLVVADHGHRPTSPRDDPTAFGVVGMRERARGLGGELSAGPAGDGWRVEAVLPFAGSDGSDA
jgi:signal transduction histidine kinase